MSLLFYRYIGKSPKTVLFSEIQTYKKITFLDESFMSRGRWDEINEQEWLVSLVAGMCMTPLVLVDIKKCLSHCIEGDDDWNYFNDLLTGAYDGEEYTYITCDGWNRNTTAFKYANQKVLLKKGIYEQEGGYQVIIRKNSTKDDLSESNKIFIDSLRVPVTFIEKATREDLGKIFVNVNKLVAQNAMELRNALKTDMAEPIRDLATDLQPYFMATGDGTSKKQGLLKEAECNRRVHDEFILDCILFVHTKFGKIWTKESRNFYYDKEISGLKTSFLFGEGIIKRMLKSGTTIETTKTEDGKDEISASRSFCIRDLRSLFMNFMLRVEIESNDSKIVDNEKFDRWVQDKHTAMLNDPTIQMKQYEADGKTIKKVFTYKSASRRSPDQLVWSRGLYLQALCDTDLTIAVDPKRLFTMTQKFEMWQRQGGVVGKSDAICPETNKKISLSELYESYLWQADHIIPWDKSGKTVVSNGRIISAAVNRAKSNSSPLDLEAA